MALTQTDTDQSRLLTLAPKRPLQKTVELQHVFSPNPPGTAEGEISCPSTIPKFNLDLSFFTPAFVLGTDQNYYRFNQQFEYQKFMDKRRQAQAELSNPNLDRVGPNQNFCQICKESYLNYPCHIVSAVHKNCLKLSKAHAYIQDLCTSFHQPHPKHEKQHNRKGKTRSNTPKKQRGRNKKVKGSDSGEKNIVSQASSQLTFPTLPHKQGLQ